MKTIRFTAFFILFGLLVLVSACKKETKPTAAPQTGSKIMVTGQGAAAGLKTTIDGLSTVWVAGEQVGIYSAEARTASGGVSAIVNAPFTAATSAASSTFSGTMYWGEANTSHTFYAYYPYSGSAGTNATIVPVSLSTTQTQSAANNSDHIGALDFMVATPVTVTSPGSSAQIGNNVVNLSYNHLFTVLEFQIKRSSGSSKITKIKLTAPTTNLSLTSGTVNITSATPGAGVSYTISSPSGTKEITLTITGGVTPTSDYATTPKIYMMILPGDFSAEVMTIGLEYESSPGVFVNTTKLGKLFARGTKYVVQLEQATDVQGKVYFTVINPTTGKIWLDRNLGATQVATSSADPLACGDYYQWGRGTDGHQISTSLTTNTISSTDIPVSPDNVKFIIPLNVPWDWHSPQNVNLWQGVNGVNNPCPSGYRLPTYAELMAERTSWTSLGTVGAFGSPLKLPAAGYHLNTDGSLYAVGSAGYYWSSTVVGTDSRDLFFYSGFDSNDSQNYRAAGCSVRCIKDY